MVFQRMNHWMFNKIDFFFIFQLNSMEPFNEKDLNILIDAFNEKDEFLIYDRCRENLLLIIPTFIKLMYGVKDQNPIVKYKLLTYLALGYNKTISGNIPEATKILLELCNLSYDQIKILQTNIDPDLFNNSISAILKENKFDDATLLKIINFANNVHNYGTFMIFQDKMNELIQLKYDPNAKNEYEKAKERFDSTKS